MKRLLLSNLNGFLTRFLGITIHREKDHRENNWSSLLKKSQADQNEDGAEKGQEVLTFGLGSQGHYEFLKW